MKIRQARDIQVRYLFYGLICFLIIVVIVGVMQGKKQDQENLNNYEAFLSIDRLIQTGQVSEAEDILNSLIQKAPSYSLYWKYAYLLDVEGKYQQSLEYLSKARELNPLLVGDQKYLFSYGSNLLYVGDYNKAKQYFNKAVDLNADVRISTQAKEYLEEITKKQ